MTDRERSLGNIWTVLWVLMPYRRRHWKTYLGYSLGLVVSTLATGVAIPLLFRSFIDTLSVEGVAPDVLFPALWTTVTWIGAFATVGVLAILCAELFIT